MYRAWQTRVTVMAVIGIMEKRKCGSARPYWSMADVRKPFLIFPIALRITTKMIYASSDRGNGAIGWASEKPNILNVAVTRAKNRLYIVGDAKRWSGRPFFKTVYEICTKRSPAL